MILFFVELMSVLSCFLLLLATTNTQELTLKPLEYTPTYNDQKLELAMELINGHYSPPRRLLVGFLNGTERASKTLLTLVSLRCFDFLDY